MKARNPSYNNLKLSSHLLRKRNIFFHHYYQFYFKNTSAQNHYYQFYSKNTSAQNHYYQFYFKNTSALKFCYSFPVLSTFNDGHHLLYHWNGKQGYSSSSMIKSVKHTPAEIHYREWKLNMPHARRTKENVVQQINKKKSFWNKNEWSQSSKRLRQKFPNFVTKATLKESILPKRRVELRILWLGVTRVTIAPHGLMTKGAEITKYKVIFFK